MAKAYIFGVEDVMANLGLTTILSSTTILEPQGFSHVINQSLAPAMGNHGDILVDDLSLQAQTPYDIKQTFSVSLVTKADATAAATIKLGGTGCTMTAPYSAAVATNLNFGLYGHFVLTGFSMTQPAAGFAKFSFTGHAHFFNATTGTPLPHIAQAYKITVPEFGFGVQGLPNCCGTINGASPTLADFSNYTFGAEVGHTDELDRSGKFLIGASHGAKITESFTLSNYNDGTFGHAIQGCLFVPATNWQIPSDARAASNTAYESRTFSAETYQVHD